jgi:hypothetical protein
MLLRPFLAATEKHFGGTGRPPCDTLPVPSRLHFRPKHQRRAVTNDEAPAPAFPRPPQPNYGAAAEIRIGFV